MGIKTPEGAARCLTLSPDPNEAPFRWNRFKETEQAANEAGIPRSGSRLAALFSDDGKVPFRGNAAARNIEGRAGSFCALAAGRPRAIPGKGPASATQRGEMPLLSVSGQARGALSITAPKERGGGRRSGEREWKAAFVVLRIGWRSFGLGGGRVRNTSFGDAASHFFKKNICCCDSALNGFQRMMSRLRIGQIGL